MRASRGNNRYSRGRWQVQRERCQIEEPKPPASYHDSTPLGQVIARVIQNLDTKVIDFDASLADDWAGVVGPTVAKHTRPGGCRDGHLVVHVDSPVWLSELARYGRHEILAKLQQRYGAARVRSVSLELAPG